MPKPSAEECARVAVERFYTATLGPAAAPRGIDNIDREVATEALTATDAYYAPLVKAAQETDKRAAAYLEKHGTEVVRDAEERRLFSSLRALAAALREVGE